MTHEEICTYEVCKLAKEKGFNCKVYNYYQATKHYCETLRGIELHSVCRRMETDNCYSRYNKGSEDIVSAPTQSLLQRWLRENKRVVFGISPMQEMDCDYLGWCATIYKVDENGYGLSWKEELYRNTYELALEDALKYALENLV